jgi:hypothetical protein
MHWVKAHLIMFLGAVTGGVTWWLLAPLLLIGTDEGPFYTDVMRMILVPFGVTGGLLAGFLVARATLSEEDQDRDDLPRED